VTQDLASQSFGRLVPDRLLDTHLARVLFGAQRSRRSGVLTVDEGSITTRIHLLEGGVVYVDRGPLAETLGRLLMRQGTIDREEYLVILERMSAPSGRDEILRFGDVAIQLGMLTSNELHEALSLQVEQKLERCLQLDEGFWHFDAHREPSRSRFPVKLEHALRAALRDDPQAFRWAGLLVARRRLHIELVEPADTIAARFEITPAELRFLHASAGRPVADALASRQLEPTEAGVLLVALLFAGVLRLGEHDSGRLRRSEVEALRTAAHAHQRERSPGPTAQEREAQAREAAKRLAEEMERRGHAPTERGPRLEAERAFEDGRKLLASNAIGRALATFERASALMPEASEYRLYACWCRFADEKDPVHRSVYEQDLRACALDALNVNRRLGFAHYVHGRLFLAEDDLEAAERALRFASKLDPGHTEAARYLRLVQSRNKG